jgi:hypothetical protein
MICEEESVDAGVIGCSADILIPEEAEMLHEQICLSSTNLEGDEAAGGEEGRGLGEEGADDAGAIGAAIEGVDGVATDFGGEGGDIGGGDVGEVGDDEVVGGGGEGGEEVAVVEADAGGEGEEGGVFGGEGEGIRGDVDGVDGGVGPLGGKGEGDYATADADVEDEGGFVRKGEEEFDEVLGLVAGDEGAWIAEEGAAVELDGAEKVLEGLAGGTAFHEEAEGIEFAVGEGAVEFEVEFEAFFAENVREEELGVEAGALDAVFLEVTGGGCDDVLHGFQGASIKADARELARALGKWAGQWKSAALCAFSISIVSRASAAI